MGAVLRGIRTVKPMANFTFHALVVIGAAAVPNGALTVQPPASFASRPKSARVLMTIERQERDGPTAKATELLAGV